MTLFQLTPSLKCDKICAKRWFGLAGRTKCTSACACCFVVPSYFTLKMCVKQELSRVGDCEETNRYAENLCSTLPKHCLYIFPCNFFNSFLGAMVITCSSTSWQSYILPILSVCSRHCQFMTSMVSKKEQCRGTGPSAVIAP